MIRIFIRYCLMLWFLAMQSIEAQATITINYIPTEDPNDARLDYAKDILRLSLSKSVPSEKIDIIRHQKFMSFSRTLYDVKQNFYPNYFLPGGINVEQLGAEGLQAVDFPLDHGLLSYRICFVSPQAKERVAKANTLDDLRQFAIVQGTNWPDVSILKANGFRVVEVPLYASLFKMVVSNRADLFCRGINELRTELIQYRHYGNLIYDESFVLVYAMPYKLYFNQESAPLIAKIETGLAIAHQDGSLDTLFKQYFSEDLLFAKLDQRKRFVLTSGYEASFSETYKRYLYDPYKTK